MTFKLTRWQALRVGDLARLRPKRVSGERVEVVIAGLLDRDLRDGVGLIDENGAVFRQWHYDVEVLQTTAPTEPQIKSTGTSD